jgi:Replication-relaxation
MNSNSNAEAETLVLTERDLQLLDLVYELRGCTSRQLHARFWGEARPVAACYRRLAKLVDGGYLASRRLPSKTGVGSGKRFLALGPAGRRVISSRHRLPLKEIVTADASSFFFADHHEMVGDVRVALDASLKVEAGVVLRGWVPETDLRGSPIRITDTFKVRGTERSRVVTLVPDAEFTLAVGGRAQRYFLEADMGTIAMSRLLVRIRGYLRFQFDEVCPVLFVAPDEIRMRQIGLLAEQQADALHAYGEFIYLTTIGDVHARSLLYDAIWCRSGKPGREALLASEPRTLQQAS